MKPAKLLLSTETLVLGSLSVPLAFLRQLCVPALIMAVLAIAFHLLAKRSIGTREPPPGSIRRSRLGFRMAMAGGLCALAMWVLWATGVLL